MSWGLGYKNRRKVDEEREFTLVKWTINSSAEYNEEKNVLSKSKTNRDTSVPMKQTWYDLGRILELFSHKKRDVPVPNQSKFSESKLTSIINTKQDTVQIDENFYKEVKYPKIFKQTKEYIKYIPKCKKEVHLSDDDRLLDLEYKIVRQVYWRNCAVQILPILNKDVGIYFKNLFQNSNKLIDSEIDKTNESDNFDESDEIKWSKKNNSKTNSSTLKDIYNPILIEGRDEEGEFCDNILQYFNDPFRYSPPMKYLNRPCRKQDYKSRHMLWAFSPNIIQEKSGMKLRNKEKTTNEKLKIGNMLEKIKEEMKIFKHKVNEQYFKAINALKCLDLYKEVALSKIDANNYPDLYSKLKSLCISDQINPYKSNLNQSREYICNYDYNSFNSKMSEEFDALSKLSAEEIYDKFQNFMKLEAPKISNDSYDEMMMRPKNTLNRMRFEYRKEMFKYLLNKSRMKIQLYKAESSSTKRRDSKHNQIQKYDIQQWALDSLDAFSKKLSKKEASTDKYQSNAIKSLFNSKIWESEKEVCSQGLPSSDKKFQIWKSRGDRLLIRQKVQETDDWEKDNMTKADSETVAKPPKRFVREIKQKLGDLWTLDIDKPDLTVSRNLIKFDDDWSIRFEAEESMGDYTFD